MIDGNSKDIPFEYVSRYMTYESCIYYYLHQLINSIVQEDYFADVKFDKDVVHFMTFLMTEIPKFGLIGDDTCPHYINPNRMLRLHSSALREQYGANVTPIYSTDDQIAESFEIGAYSITQRVISDLELLDESAIEWKQVAQFREDKKARYQYSRFLLYLKGKWNLENKEFFAYEIEEAYHDYCKSLKKHGFKTVKGFIKDFFSAEFVLPQLLHP